MRRHTSSSVGDRLAKSSSNGLLHSMAYKGCGATARDCIGSGGRRERPAGPLPNAPIGP